MTSNLKIFLNSSEIQKISSEYLREGRRNDIWEIVDASIEEFELFANVRMTSYYQSPTDNDGFHLSSFATLEFVSQLFVIYGHVLAGLEKKTQEAWMLNSSINCTKAIRDPNNIRVQMKFKVFRKIKNRMLGQAIARVWDEQGGEFTVNLKALLS